MHISPCWWLPHPPLIIIHVDILYWRMRVPYIQYRINNWWGICIIVLACCVNQQQHSTYGRHTNLVLLYQLQTNRTLAASELRRSPKSLHCTVATSETRRRIYKKKHVFFSHTKSANNTFSHGLSAKQTQTNRPKSFGQIFWPSLAEFHFHPVN